MNTGKIVLGVLGGIAVGALLGILFAPEKGSDMRKKITKKGEDYVDGIKDKFDEALDSLSEKMDQVKEEVSDFIEQPLHKAEDLKKHAHQTKA